MFVALFRYNSIVGGCLLPMQMNYCLRRKRLWQQEENAKHELTEQEIEFYKELSTALYNIRSVNGKSVPEMAKRCGYSDVYIRNIENFGLENVSPIPAYIVAVYIEACNVKMDDICEGWLNRKDKPAVKETHARRIKYITVGENDLLQRMRKFQVNGSSGSHSFSGTCQSRTWRRTTDSKKSKINSERPLVIILAKTSAT